MASLGKSSQPQTFRSRGTSLPVDFSQTAFGIMLGTVSSLVFYHVPDPATHITGLNWRSVSPVTVLRQVTETDPVLSHGGLLSLMLGSAALPAFFVMAQVFFCPESPRWLM